MSWLRSYLFGSIRGRLLLLLSGGLSTLLLALFLLLDYSIDRQIFGRLDDTLLARARGIVVLLESHPATEAMAELQAMSPEYAGSGHTDFLQIWDQQGRTLLASDSNRRADLTPPDRVPANAPMFYDLRLPDGHRGRAVALRVGFVGGRGEAVLAVAEEREQVDLLERRVHFALIVGVLGTALLAALLAVLAVRGGLRPLLRFGDAASGDGGRSRLPVDDLPRELQPFAVALNDAFARLHAALERERRFARDVAHELRTPLAEVRTAVELARRDAVDLRPLDGAIASTERMRRCIDGLLALSRYEAGMDRAEVEPLDAAGLLRRSLAAAAGAAHARSLRIETTIPEECWVSSDPALLERIAENLLLNAVEYAPVGSTLQVVLAEDPTGVALRIGNPAPDLDAEDVACMGERFWRKSPAREASRHGGLGLALSRTLADVLGLNLAFELEHGVLWAELAALPAIAAAAEAP